MSRTERLINASPGPDYTVPDTNRSRLEYWTHMAIQSHTKVKEFVKFLIDQEPRILFNILNKLPKMGIGRKVTRVTWNLQDPNFLVRPAYWTITKVIPNEVGR